MTEQTMKSKRLLRTLGQSTNSHPWQIGRGRSGQSLVEVALVLPLILLLLLGVIEFGRYLYIGIIIGNAAHAGAIYGARDINNTCSACTGITQAATNDFTQNGLNASALAVTWSNSCGCDNGGTIINQTCTPTGAAPTCPTGQNWAITLTVTAEGQFTSLFNYPGLPVCTTTNPCKINKKSAMRVANYN
jgi:Flp pilus assembly protein TadG